MTESFVRNCAFSKEYLNIRLPEEPFSIGKNDCLLTKRYRLNARSTQIVISPQALGVRMCNRRNPSHAICVRHRVSAWFWIKKTGFELINSGFKLELVIKNYVMADSNI